MVKLFGLLIQDYFVCCDKNKLILSKDKHTKSMFKCPNDNLKAKIKFEYVKPSQTHDILLIKRGRVFWKDKNLLFS